MIGRNIVTIVVLACVVLVFIVTSPAGSRSGLTERRVIAVEEKVDGIQKEVASLRASQVEMVRTLQTLSDQLKGGAMPQIAGSANEATERSQTMQVAPMWAGGPTDVHVFSSGVKVWQHYLRKAQRERFAIKNLWEQLDEPLIAKVLQHAQPGDVFLDCGAALGYYSLLARRLSPDIIIHAFNPHPKFVERMRNNMKLNGVDDITIHQVAIADKSMQGIKITSAGFGGRIQPNKLGDINTTTLNEFMKTISGWKRILLVKADVEGFELKMLSAATDLFGVVQNWVIAIHQTRQQCGEMLKKVGYEVIAEDPVRVQGEPNGVLVATLNRATYFPEYEKDASD